MKNRTKEILIDRLTPEELCNVQRSSHILGVGYRKTGNKFRISINGSRGYLCDISISCEMNNGVYNNKVRRGEIYTSKGRYRKRKINIYHSHSHGIRVSTGKDSARDNHTEDPLPSTTDLHKGPKT